MIYVFGEWELDTDPFELRRGESPVRVEPQVYDLLRFLLLNKERVVGRDELVEEIWDGRFVTDATISTCVKSARQAIGDDGRSQRFLQTVRGRGLRFVGDVLVATEGSVRGSPLRLQSRSGRTTESLRCLRPAGLRPRLRFICPTSRSLWCCRFTI